MRHAIDSLRSAYAPFCEGRIYMLLIGALVLGGHLLHIEFWLNIVHVLLLCLSLCLSDSVKPLIVSNMIFIFQVTLKHSPSAPNYSTYYFEGAHLYIVVVLVALLVASLVYYLLRTGFFKHLHLRKTPLLIPLLALSAAFLTNGLFFEQYTISNLTFGFTQVAVYLLDFLVLYDGLTRVDAEEIMSFAVDLSLMVSWILIAQLVNAYVLNVTPGDMIDKNEILFGWGISNTCACCLSVQIPILFYGMFRGKRFLPSFLTVCAVFFAIVCTLSRSGVLFACMILVLCLAYACLFGEHRKKFVLCAVGVLLIIGISLVMFRDKMQVVIQHFLQLGFSDTGRFDLWNKVLQNFKLSPIFGVGFYGRRILSDLSGVIVYTDFYPEFAHNTPLEMLASCGIVGLVAYAVMRLASMKVFFVRRSAEKTFLGFAVLVFLLECLLDVFTFTIYPVFFYNFFLAAAFALDAQMKAKEKERGSTVAALR